MREPDPPVLELVGDGSFMYYNRAGKMCGMRFHGYDVVNTAGRIRRVAAESPRATHRIFVQADTARWTYPFAVGDNRRLGETVLDAQFAAATYTAPGVREGSRDPGSRMTTFTPAPPERSPAVP